MSDVVSPFSANAFGARAAGDGQPLRARRRPRVLCVDDEQQMLDSLRDMLRRQFDVVVTTNGFEALRLLTAEEFDVVLSDMRMPMINGARFLTLAREHAPDTVRLLLTGQSTVDSAIAAVNEGEVFRFLVKPCPPGDLIEALNGAADRHVGVRQERELRRRSLEGTVSAFLDIAATIDPGSRDRAERLRTRVVELAERADGVPATWELQRAAELTQLGVVGLEPELRAALASSATLPARETARLERLPELAVRYLAPIPSLSPVAAILTDAAEPLVPTRPGLAGTLTSARILRIVLDHHLLTRGGMPADTALRAMRAREGRYDAELLSTFRAVLGA